MSEKYYLDEQGLAEVANHVNSRLKTVTVMPQNPADGIVRLYVGATNNNFTKGHIYQYNTNAWTDITEVDQTFNPSSTNAQSGIAIGTELDKKVDKESGKGLSTNDFTDTLKDKLDGIETGAQVNTVTGVKGDSESSYRTGNINITKDNIGLGNVVNTGDSATPVENGTTKFTTGGAYTELNKKVDKENGKGLSTNDFTDAYKTKLEGIETGAEVNVQSDWSQTNNASDDFIKNKPVIDTTVTEDSSNLITSGAVYTAIANETSAREDSESAIQDEIDDIDDRVSDIEDVIPNQASTSNQLADKDFVNSSIATNTANFLGTFESISDLRAYSGTVTNNDYAFVRNGVVEYNGGDFPNVTTLNNYDKNLLTNGDYAWVVNSEDNTKFDLYRFDIIEQSWISRATKVAKSSEMLNSAFNRYKATVSGSTVTWIYEYTLNNSSFTAEQWATINSGLTQESVASDISSAINDLDADSVGGSGKYISAISESDGIISATEGTIDSSPTQGSNNPITSGAVYTGLDGKVDKSTAVTGVKGNSESTYRTGNVNITKANVGLGSVVDTGDSATPVENGTTKFTTGGAYTELAKKQDVLTFDTAPAASSTNPVTSNGIKTAIDNAETNAKNLANATGTLAIDHGGTGATTDKAAQNNLLGSMNQATDDLTDDTQFVFKYGTPSDSNGALCNRTAQYPVKYFNNRISGRPHIVCGTAASTVAKTASLAGFVLMKGAELTIEFTNTNTASNPTLSVNGTTAAQIMGLNGNPVGSGNQITSGKNYYLTYDGEYWFLDESCNVPNARYAPYSGEARLSESASNAKYYGTCSTSRATNAKVVTCDDFVLVTGCRIVVNFTDTAGSAPTSGNITMNINSTGAKNVYNKNGIQMTYAYSGEFRASRRCEFVYDGTQYIWLNYDSNTTYSTITQAEITAGTSTGSRLVTPKLLVDNFVKKESGKGLSTNDFTTELKDKLDGIEAGAQVNSVTGVKGNSESTYRTGDVNITKSNIGLGNVANTGDSDTPVSGGTTKFTTGGAYTELRKKTSTIEGLTAVGNLEYTYNQDVFIVDFITKLRTKYPRDTTNTIVKFSWSSANSVNLVFVASPETSSLRINTSGLTIIGNLTTISSTSAWLDMNLLFIDSSNRMFRCRITKNTASEAVAVSINQVQSSISLPLSVANGGTGKTTAQGIVDDTIQAGIAPNTDATSDVTDDTEVITTHVNGYSTTNKRLYRRTAVKIWNYIKSKLGLGSATTTYLRNDGTWTTPIDTKNTAGSTDTSSKIFLIGATTQDANPQTYSDNEVYATNGVLTTKSVQVGGTAATMQYNSTTQSIEFVFN